MAKDPVCGMQVKESSPLNHEFDGNRYYFCDPRCLERFKVDPPKFLSPPSPKAEPSKKEDGDAIYTCPMHPEVRKKGPGTCPKCAMALEPLEITAEEGPNPELIDMTRRFVFSAGESLPLVVLSMSEMFSRFPLSQWIQFFLATPVVFWGDGQF